LNIKYQTAITENVTTEEVFQKNKKKKVKKKISTKNNHMIF